MSSEFERLSPTIVPLRYHLHLFPNLETFKFDGKVEVELDIKEKTNSIVCYAAELDIKSAHLGEQEATVQLVKEEERVRFAFETTVEPGPCRIIIQYSGFHNDKRMGFYRSKSIVSQ